MQQLLTDYNLSKNKWLAFRILSNLEDKIIFNNKVNIDLSNINNSIIEDCKYLSNLGFVIGGSISLKIFGMLDRDINDFDLFLDENIDYNKVKEKYNSNSDDSEDNEDDQYKLMGSSKFKAKIRINNIDKSIDIFNLRKNYLMIEGIKIQSNPFDALRAKLKYNRDKDKNDFIEIFNKII